VPANELQVGDPIAGMSESGCERIQTVTAVEAGQEARVTIVSGAGSLTCSRSHPLAMFTGGFRSAGSLWVGAKLLCADGSETEVKSIEELPEGPVIKIVCEPDHIYIAGGLVQHNPDQPKTSSGTWV
jgi:hypothetical protein